MAVDERTERGGSMELYIIDEGKVWHYRHSGEPGTLQLVAMQQGTFKVCMNWDREHGYAHEAKV